MRLIDADKLNPDRMTNKGTVAISQSQIAKAPTKGTVAISQSQIAKAPTVQAIPIDALNKIRAEIKQLPYQRIFGKVSNYSLLDAVVEIIDKYIGDTE